MVGGDETGELAAAYSELARLLLSDPSPEEYAFAGPAMAAVLNDVPAFARGEIAMLIGMCVESGADPVACSPQVLGNLYDSLERAREFARVWSERRGGELPDPEAGLDTSLIGEFESPALVAWFDLPKYRFAGVMTLLSREVLDRLGPTLETLRASHEAFVAQAGEQYRYSSIDQTLKLLVDEPLVVLHRATRTGFRLRMSGIGSNAQLHTMLAQVLIGGGHLEGKPPAAAAVAACWDGGEPVHTSGSFELVAPHGAQISHEDAPWDIPVVDGVRVLVLDPLSAKRLWPTGRHLPSLAADLVLEEVLSAAETDAWFAHMRTDHPGSGRNELLTAIADLRQAMDGDDFDALLAADSRMVESYQGASPDELRAAAEPLTALLPEVMPLERGRISVLIGGCVEFGADPVPCAPKVLAYLAKALEHGRSFAEAWAARQEAPGAGSAAEITFPDPEDVPPLPFDELFEEFGMDAVMAWWALPDLKLSALTMLRFLEVRKRLGPIQAMLRERLDAFDSVSGQYYKPLDYVLKLLDDEPLIVLHRDTRTGYRMRMSGLSINFQLHTLLADALIGGGHLPGEAPSAEAVAMCRDVEGRVPTWGSFNLVAPDGSWIWNEGTPSDIPVIDGVRLLVLDQEPYRRTWPAGRYFPEVPGDLVLERTLTDAETESWFAHVKPSERSGGDALEWPFDDEPEA
ncbi:hypothetical protein [Nocardia sp. NPDC048505]|uniref:hypothetical protein n=1 Tax=unclassified Nocardia TaxID=2637762 RepID=UPI0033F8E6ED